MAVCSKVLRNVGVRKGDIHEHALLLNSDEARFLFDLLGYVGGSLNTRRALGSNIRAELGRYLDFTDFKAAIDVRGTIIFKET